MGDTGSLFLGSYLSTLILGQNSIISILNFNIMLSHIARCFTCILMRLSKKQNILQPHKLHLYQRLVSGGLSHSKVSLIYISITLRSVYLTSNTYLLGLAFILVIIVGLHLNKNYAKVLSNLENIL